MVEPPECNAFVCAEALTPWLALEVDCDSVDGEVSLSPFTKFVPYVVYMSGRVAYNVNKKYAKKDMGPSFMLVGYVCWKYSMQQHIT